MKVVSVISTKGGVGKTTTAANLGGFIADAGLKVLLVDLDVQPTLSSYFTLVQRAAGGIYELLALNESRPERLISHTAVPNLDLILSNDERGELNSLLLQAPDGRLRLKHLRQVFEADYDLMLIDTQGARSALLEMAVLASDLALSPVTPELLAARELRRGTVQLIQDLAPFRHWGIEPPPLKLLLNRVPPVSATARLIEQTLRQILHDDPAITVLSVAVPQLEVYPRASTTALPVHRIEARAPSGRVAPAAAETMRALARELFPQWSAWFAGVTDASEKLTSRAGRH
jgi:chromosome partitioning related protein ParA